MTNAQNNTWTVRIATNSGTTVAAVVERETETGTYVREVELRLPSGRRPLTEREARALVQQVRRVGVIRAEFWGITSEKIERSDAQAEVYHDMCAAYGIDPALDF